MRRRKAGTLILLFGLWATMLLALDLAFRASAAVDPAPPDAAASSKGGTSAQGDVGSQSASAAGEVLGVFTNTWSHSTLGLVFDPVRNRVRYAHESQSSSSNPTIYDVDPLSYTVIHSMALSAKNPDWPHTLDNRSGVGYDAGSDTFLLPDLDGDLFNADDNIVEITPDGTILNAWEMDDEVGSNDSSDGSAIDNILDIAVVPGDPTRYFVTAADDGSIAYEIALTKTGTQWTENSWSTVATYTVPGPTDNLGIDYDAQHERLYHTGRQTTTIVVTDLGCSVVETFTCPSDAGFHSGVTIIEGAEPPEVWVTNYDDNRTTRCVGPAAGTPGVDWSTAVDGEAWTPGLVVTAETSDTIEVVDVFTATQAASLLEEWDGARLELLDWATSPTVGAITTRTNSLRWDMPPSPAVMTMTTWFHVAPSTWLTTPLTEALLLDDGVHEERAVTVEKEPSVLTLQAFHPDGVLPGGVATYTLAYGNKGGYENGVSVLSTLPVTVPIVHADPLPDVVSADGTVAVWEVGDLAKGSVGEIGVAVAITTTATPSRSIGIESAIRNHVEEIAARASFAYHVQEVAWEKEVWVNGRGPLAPEGGPYDVVPGDGVRVVDRVHVAAAAPVSLALREAWSDALALSGWEASGGSVEASSGALTWHGVELEPNAWHGLTKTFRVTSGGRDGGTLTETLTVAGADPATVVRTVGFERNARLFLPLVMRH